MSSVSERLFQQIKRQQEREAALEAAQSEFGKASLAREAAKKLRDSADEKVETLHELQKKLEKKAKDNAADMQSLAEAHEAERKALMARLEERVSSINARVEATAVAKAKVESENARLKEQISILESHKTSGSSKFEELMAARDKEVGSFSTQIEKEGMISELLKKQNEMTKIQIDKLTVIHDTLKGKVERYADKFNAFQEQLKAARGIFDESQKNRERLARRLVTLKEERQASMARAVRARKDYEIEEAKVATAEKQLATLESQIAVLTQLANSIASGAATTTKAGGATSAGGSSDVQTTTETATSTEVPSN